MIWFVVIVGCLNLLLGFLLAVGADGAATLEPLDARTSAGGRGEQDLGVRQTPGNAAAAGSHLATDSRSPPAFGSISPRTDGAVSAAASDASPESTASVTSDDEFEPLAEPLAELPVGTTVGFRLEELPPLARDTGQRRDFTRLAPGSNGAGDAARSRTVPISTHDGREPLRAGAAAADADALKQLCTDLVAINRDWHDRQMEAAELIKERSGTHGDYEQVAMDLEQALHDQAATIKNCEVIVDSLHHRTEIETGCKRVFESIGQLVDQAHLLRDRLNDLLATVLRDAGNLAEVTTELQLDRVTGLLNRIGAELLFDDWWRADPDRTRHLSAALIDIDRLGRVNQRLGTRVGDQTVCAREAARRDLPPRSRHGPRGPTDGAIATDFPGGYRTSLGALGHRTGATDDRGNDVG